MSQHAATVRLACAPTAVRAARQFVREHCAAWGLPPETCDRATLVASELVTNAVTHAQTPSQLCVSDSSSGTLCLEVSDEATTTPAARPPSLDADTGRGIALVDALSTCWGVRGRDGGGKVVWAEISGPR